MFIHMFSVKMLFLFGMLIVNKTDIFLFSVMKMLSGLQRSPNEFIPVHKHLRSYSQRLTIWDLPEEIIVHLLKTLHVKDLLCMRQV